MAITAGDWSVTRSTGNIRYIGDDHGGGSPSYATVIEFHRWLQGLADDASSTGDRNNMDSVVGGTSSGKQANNAIN